MSRKKASENALAGSSSPYLLQHAHNPVDWMPWGKEAREKALVENKPMLVSIGYSACHWCHVMEHESFEDEEVAARMNRHFVCVKVDREERPDVDQVYMEAVQRMSGQGGWPLNCFTTPDGKPIYGGTYYPKAQWMQVLKQLADMWHDDPQQVQKYGDQLAKGMEVSGGIAPTRGSTAFDLAPLDTAVAQWKTRFDTRRGGPNKAPKFPLPCNHLFLMHYALVRGDEESLKQVELTLDAMALGGIYDHVGGGFARYSVDADWKVPHFEKMLYDNAQLLGLYTEAYGAFAKRSYLETARGIKSWLRREMRNGHGGYFSALDADSEGVEGLFYTWSPDQVLVDATLAEGFKKYYHTDHKGLWEGRIIPVRKHNLTEMAKASGRSEAEEASALHAYNAQLLAARSTRIRPGTDDKTLCSWNAMLAAGFATSYQYTGEPEDLKEAIAIMAFIDRHMTDPGTAALRHSWKEGVASGEGFLEDYAFYIDACLKLYQACHDEEWLHKAKEMAMQAIDLFYDDAKGLFFFTAHTQSDLIVRPVELSDNVIPSSNSVMAHHLTTLGSIFGLGHFREKAVRLLRAVEKAMEEYAEGYACWADLHLRLAMGEPELVIGGPDASRWLDKLTKTYRPCLLTAAAKDERRIPIFAGRTDSTHTRIFICQHHSCQAPFEDVQEAHERLDQMYREWQ